MRHSVAAPTLAVLAIVTFFGDVLASLPPPQPGNVNHDNIVDLADVNYVTARWLNTGTPGSLDGDADGNGVVDLGDINVITAHWLNTGEPTGIDASVPPMATIPETARLAFSALPAVALLVRRRR